MSLPDYPHTLLPVHLKPLPDELLSSWLIRLAHAHGLKLQTFCAQLFGRDKSIWNRDIDKLAPDWLVARLSTATATPIERIMDTSLRSYEGYLYEKHQPNGNTRWILPLGVYHRTHRNPGLLCCPACLTEDKSPYFRRSWRLALNVVCTKHKAWLIDSCPVCKLPIEPHRSDMQSKEYFPFANQLAYCWNCSYDLRQTPFERVTDRTLLGLQNRIEQALGRGYTNWAGNPSMFSVVFFDGLRAFIAGVTSKRSIARIAQFSEQPELCGLRFSESGFECASIEHRRAFIAWASHKLDMWPQNFEYLIMDAKLRYADLIGDSTTRPFWYESVIWNCAGGGYALISDEEVIFITHATETLRGKFSVGSARMLSGRDLTPHIPKQVAVSDDTYEDLMTSIDHEIAGTLDRIKRACLIRDKVMFATGRILSLNESALSCLTLDLLRRMVPSKARPVFGEAAKNKIEVRSWVEWYWEEIRGQLRPAAGVEAIFTSPNTRKQLGRSSVGAIFKQRIEQANLRRRIGRYSSWCMH